MSKEALKKISGNFSFLLSVEKDRVASTSYVEKISVFVSKGACTVYNMFASRCDRNGKHNKYAALINLVHQDLYSLIAAAEKAEKAAEKESAASK